MLLCCVTNQWRDVILLRFQPYEYYLPTPGCYVDVLSRPDKPRLTLQHSYLRAESGWDLLVNALCLQFPELRAAICFTLGKIRECHVPCGWKAVPSGHFAVAS